MILTNSFNCTSTSQPVSVTVNSIPNVTINALGSTTICQNDSVILTSNFQPHASSYQWLKNNVPVSAYSSTFSANTGGDYSVIVTSSENCTATSNGITININPLPSVSVSSREPTTFCSGNNVQLNATYSQSYTYQWEKNGNIISGAVNFYYTVFSVGNYNVKVTDKNNCSAFSQIISVIVNPAPVVNLGNDTTIYEDAVLNLNAGSGDSQYLWSDGSQNQTLSINGSAYGIGDYEIYVTVTNSYSCSTIDSVNINIISTPISLTFQPLPSCTGDTAIINVNTAHFNNVGSASIMISYDTLVLKYLSIENINPQISSLTCYSFEGILYFNWYTLSNPANIDQGQLFGIIFINNGGSSPINFVKGTQIYNDNPDNPQPLQLILNDIVFTGGPYTITGSVTYNNLKAYPLGNTKLILFNSTGLKMDSVSTDNNGNYIFNNVKCSNYYFNVSSNLSIGNKAVTPLDALLVNRYYIKAYKFLDNLKKLAADVNNDGKINPIDALMINRKYIKALKTFPAGIWIFNNTATSVNGADAINNFQGNAFGDVDGSYSP